MEGVLRKWTNYLSGWQPRYFVLDNNVLSYYDSQEDVGKGSKGSLKMGVCEIKVHSTDLTRIDLVIPGEQWFYLKAVNAAERQKWLVALGSAKACLTDSRTRREKEMGETKDSLKSKMSELRLYCDLLMQQVHTIQESTQPAQSEGTPDIEKMTEASSLLKATCNQFISTLEECMSLSKVRLAPDLCSLSPPSSPASPPGSTPTHFHRVRRSMSHTGVVPIDRSIEMIRPPLSQDKGGVTVLRNLEEMATFRAQRSYRQNAESQRAESIMEEMQTERLAMSPDDQATESGH
ncbi:pleckstrin homology domain-containing family A member 3 isoform X3 [Latimeria chalumnae]|uniref:pleckstrin homology domain-containing family A member 3 isoform X3 n=1 Tax=Latimeria chalumnae TaxID=7897 RepID=UPI00313CB676